MEPEGLKSRTVFDVFCKVLDTRSCELCDTTKDFTDT